MTQVPEISVIVPAYNAERTILSTIDSIQQQTFSDFELIVINDGSTDQTLKLLQSIQDPRLKVFSYDNGGLSTARNRGIAHSSGAFLSFIDADDQWTVDKLEYQLKALQQHPAAGAAYSWTSCMDEQGETFYPGTTVSYTGNVYKQLLVNNFIASGSNVLLRRQVVEAIGDFDPSLKSCEDWDYWLRTAPQWEFVAVPKAQVLYRLSSGSMSSKLEVMEKCQLLVLERAFATAPLELQHLKKQGFSFIYQTMSQLALGRGSEKLQTKAAAQKLWKAIRLYPQTLRDRKTQTLIIKLLLLRLLPLELAKLLLKAAGKSHASSAPVA